MAQATACADRSCGKADKIPHPQGRGKSFAKLGKKCLQKTQYLCENRRYMSEAFFNEAKNIHSQITLTHNENQKPFDFNYEIRSTGLLFLYNYCNKELGEVQSLSPNHKWLHIVKTIAQNDDLSDKRKIELILEQCHSSRSINNFTGYRIEVIKNETKIRKIFLNLKQRLLSIFQREVN